jgi:methylenetetrahydrofolate dehydrogenase (NADP+)/methenyltetrahydrofolate cyclohydrolase
MGVFSRVVFLHGGVNKNMSARILSGRTVRDSIVPELIRRVQDLSYTPTLAIIQVGDRPDSTAFIGAKKKFAQQIGVQEKHIQVPGSISEKELISIITQCNTDTSIHAIILQLPLPEHIDRTAAIEAISPDKDADGLTSGARVMPATARGIGELLNFYKISLSGKKVTVIGRSLLVGTPVADMCRKEGATVTVCHKGSIDMMKEIAAADVLIVAAGKEKLLGREHVRLGQVVIDVGINKTQDHRLVGDVDFENVKDIVAAITPVPGGVGPMTVCALFENIVDLCEGYAKR